MWIDPPLCLVCGGGGRAGGCRLLIMMALTTRRHIPNSQSAESVTDGKPNSPYNFKGGHLVSSLIQVSFNETGQRQFLIEVRFLGSGEVDRDPTETHVFQLGEQDKESATRQNLDYSLWLSWVGWRRIAVQPLFYGQLRMQHILGHKRRWPLAIFVIFKWGIRDKYKMHHQWNIPLGIIQVSTVSLDLREVAVQ